MKNETSPHQPTPHTTEPASEQVLGVEDTEQELSLDALQDVAGGGPRYAHFS